MIFFENLNYKIRNLLSFVLIFACTALLWSQKIDKSILLTENSNFTENIAYKNDESGKEIYLDMYLPKNSSSEKIPVVVFVHGGAWVVGDKIITADNYVEHTMLMLLERKYAILSINYRLLNESTHFPAPIQDTKDAIRWVRKNANQYNFDVNNIGMWGVSAGAHLSLLNAYTQDDDFIGSPELKPFSSKVNYVVDNFGPVDMNRLLHTKAPKPLLATVGLISKKIIDIRGKLITGITGLDAQKDKKLVVEYCETISPINYSKNAVPTLILHGNKDKIAPIRHSIRLKKSLQENGIEHQFVTVKKGIHGFYNTDPAYQSQLNKIMVDFIVLHTK